MKSTQFRPTHPTYDQDLYVWLLTSADLLRKQRFSELDVDNLAEEIEGMARSDRREFINRFVVLLAHLLKWQYQPEKRSKSWERTIKEQRKRNLFLLEESPSLQYESENKLADAYELAILTTANETGLDETAFPENCEYSIAEALDPQFYPK